MKRLFALILIASACICLRAQDRLWDNALDQYQQICDECISIRARAAAGEAVQLSTMTQLLSRLSSLRKTLKDAEGQMTPAQRLRFESIRMRYEEVFGGRRETYHLPALPILTGYAEQLDFVTLVPEEYVAPMNKRYEALSYGRPRLGILVFAGIPDMYYGTLLRLSFKGKPLGAYAKGTMSIPYTKGQYECRSDGTTDSGYIWTSGNECQSRWSVSAGATISPIDFLTVYAGGGYGHREVLWKDVSGRMATVSDLLISGPAADAGVIVTLGHFSLMTGVSTIAFSCLSAEVGLGVSF